MATTLTSKETWSTSMVLTLPTGRGISIKFEALHLVKGSTSTVSPLNRDLDDEPRIEGCQPISVVFGSSLGRLFAIGLANVVSDDDLPAHESPPERVHQSSPCTAEIFQSATMVTLVVWVYYSSSVIAPNTKGTCSRQRLGPACSSRPR